MLNLCDLGHDEVCYEGRECPACNIQLEMQGEIDNLKIEIKELEDSEP